MSNNLSQKINGISMRKINWRIFKKNGFVLNSCAAAIISLASVSANAELPTNGNYVAGSGSIGVNNNIMNVNQNTQLGIINWGSFSIGSGNVVNINNGNGATMNRVIGNDVSRINGQFNATGSAYLINQNGVVVGPQGQITTGGGFVASTRDVKNEDFLNGGNTKFEGNSNADVVNLGSIQTGGDAILVGANVLNQGKIRAGGDALSAAGNKVLLSDTNAAGQRLFVEVGSGSVTNAGNIEAVNAELKASGGNIFALAINNTGTVKATGLKTEGGRLVLSAGNGTAQNAGVLDASSTTGNGGTVNVEGAKVVATPASMINASGAINGGNINFGGGYQGADKTVANAQIAEVAKGATLKADGGKGNGGKVVVWSDKSTKFEGAASAASAKARGGLVEVSSKEGLNFASWDINVKGATGNGELLLDPTDINIVNGSGASVGSSLVSANTLFADDIENWLQNSGNLTILTSSAGADAGDISFADNVDLIWNSNSTLVLSALRDINLLNTTIDASGNTGAASIIMNAARNINFAGNNDLSTGTLGSILLSSAGGNWQNGTGWINFGGGNTDITAKRIFLRSGIFDGRSDLGTNVAFNNTSSGSFGSFEINGFNNVDINANGTNSAISSDNGSFVVNAKNVLIDENITTRGDLIINAAAFDNTNKFVEEVGRVTSGVNVFSDGWVNNTGSLTFAGDGAIDLSICCGVTLTSGLDANGDRSVIDPSKVNFSYNNDTNEYKWFEAKGFEDFKTTFETGALNSEQFVYLINNNNQIDFNVDAATEIFVYSNQTTNVADVTVNAGESILFVVDEDTPFTVGTGELNIAGAEFNAPLIGVYTASRNNNSIDATFNGVKFEEGTLFTDSATEDWESFFQNNFNADASDDKLPSNPYIVYYKDIGTLNTSRPDCSTNPEQAGCDNFREFTETGKEFRVALTQDSTEPEEGALAWGNSSQVRANEFFTIKSYDYVDTNLTTTEKLQTFWYALPIQLVNIPLTGLSTVPGIQAIAEGLQGVTGGIQSTLDSVVVR